MDPSSPVFNYKLTLAYDGTSFSGWQIQPNGFTIQECLQKAIQIILRHPVSLIGSGRTDAGVHAKGQVANFTSPHLIDCHRFLASINGLIPSTIRILAIEPVKAKFHAQHSAISKIYHYYLSLERFQNPFKRAYSYHILQKIDLTQLKLAAKQFIGKRDFTSFANESHTGSAFKDPIRTLKRLDVMIEKEDICLQFEADGFLYKMVRNITGTLLEVAKGKRNIEEIATIFKAKDRRQAGQAAPPHGLFLMQVHYADIYKV